MVLFLPLFELLAGHGALHFAYLPFDTLRLDSGYPSLPGAAHPEAVLVPPVVMARRVAVVAILCVVAAPVVVVSVVAVVACREGGGGEGGEDDRDGGKNDFSCHGISELKWFLTQM
jgi:hypothetical protein